MSWERVLCLVLLLIGLGAPVAQANPGGLIGDIWRLPRGQQASHSLEGSDGRLYPGALSVVGYLEDHLEPSQAALLDLDGDGEVEDVGLEDGRAVALTQGTRVLWMSPALELTEILGAHDLTGDGHPDLLARSHRGLHILHGMSGEQVHHVPGRGVGFLAFRRVQAQDSLLTWDEQGKVVAWSLHGQVRELWSAVPFSTAGPLVASAQARAGSSDLLHLRQASTGKLVSLQAHQGAPQERGLLPWSEEAGCHDQLSLPEGGVVVASQSPQGASLSYWAPALERVEWAYRYPQAVMSHLLPQLSAQGELVLSVWGNMSELDLILGRTRDIDGLSWEAGWSTVFLEARSGEVQAALPGLRLWGQLQTATGALWVAEARGEQGSSDVVFLARGEQGLSEAARLSNASLLRRALPGDDCLRQSVAPWAAPGQLWVERLSSADQPSALLQRVELSGDSLQVKAQRLLEPGQRPMWREQGRDHQGIWLDLGVGGGATLRLDHALRTTARRALRSKAPSLVALVEQDQSGASLLLRSAQGEPRLLEALEAGRWRQTRGRRLPALRPGWTQVVSVRAQQGLAPEASLAVMGGVDEQGAWLRALDEAAQTHWALEWPRARALEALTYLAALDDPSCVDQDGPPCPRHEVLLLLLTDPQGQRRALRIEPASGDVTGDLPLWDLEGAEAGLQILGLERLGARALSPGHALLVHSQGGRLLDVNAMQWRQELPLRPEAWLSMVDDFNGDGQLEILGRSPEGGPVELLNLEGETLWSTPGLAAEPDSLGALGGTTEQPLLALPSRAGVLEVRDATQGRLLWRACLEQGRARLLEPDQAPQSCQGAALSNVYHIKASPQGGEGFPGVFVVGSHSGWAYALTQTQGQLWRAVPLEAGVAQVLGFLPLATRELALVLRNGAVALLGFSPQEPLAVRELRSPQDDMDLDISPVFGSLAARWDEAPEQNLPEQIFYEAALLGDDGSMTPFAPTGRRLEAAWEDLALSPGVIYQVMVRALTDPEQEPVYYSRAALGDGVVVVDEQPPEVSLQVEPALFSASQGQQAQLTLQMEDNHKLRDATLQITTLEGDLVWERSYELPGAAQEQRIVLWDGSDTQGALHPTDERFQVELTARDMVGQQGRATALVRRDDLAPEPPTLVWPLEGGQLERTQHTDTLWRAEPHGLLEVWQGEALLCSVRLDERGLAPCPLPPETPEGAVRLEARVTDEVGNQGDRASRSFTLSDSSLTAPVLLSPREGEALPLGEVHFTGVAPPGSQVLIKAPAQLFPLCSAQAGELGGFSCVAELTHVGQHQVVALREVEQGDAPSSAPVNFTLYQEQAAAQQLAQRSGCGCQQLAPHAPLPLGWPCWLALGLLALSWHSRRPGRA